MTGLKNPFAILKPKHVPARWNEHSFLHLSELHKRIKERSEAITVIDLETRGTEPADPEQGVVGVGVATEWGTHYSHIENPRDWQAFVTMLYQQNVPLIAHNVVFDGAWLTRDLALAQGKVDGFDDQPAFHNWHACTLATYRWLACEGWAGQQYGLKKAMVDLLGWPESNEAELHDWLIANKYVNKQGNPDKSQMWRAPSEILGKYCWYDAEATYLIWDTILQPELERFEIFETYLSNFMDLVMHVIWQKLRGIYIDRQELELYNQAITVECKQLAESFVKSSGVRESIAQFNEDLINEHKKGEPPRYKKVPELGQEPVKYTKQGSLSKNWEKWNEKRTFLQSYLPEQTIPWTRWNEKHEHMVALSQDPTNNSEQTKDLGLFNMDSAKHKQWLFYTGLKYEATMFTDNEENPQPAVDEDALRMLIPHGPMLIKYNERNKVRSMVEGCLAKMRGSLLHVGLKCPGTYTGRLGGADGLNVQNVPKDEGYLKCWKPSPGYKLITFDVSALEPHMLALASGDPTLMRMYGPESTGWDDIYLSVGSQLGGEVEERIRAAGYDPFTNTKDTVKNAKKEAKGARQIAKVIHLAASYGASANKIRQALGLQGIEISSGEAKAMHEKYWKLFAQVKLYEQFLLAQWERSGGWFLNPMGRPIAVAQDYVRDIINRSIQSAGHDAFIVLTNVVAEVLLANEIRYAPYIWDIHDCVMLEVPAEQADKCKELLDTTMLEELNSRLDGPVKLKGTANVVDNWWADKQE